MERMSDYKKEFDLACDKIVKLEEENKKLKERVSELEDVSKDYDLLSKDFIALGEENKKLKEELEWYRERYREKVDEEVLKGFGYNKKEIV